MISDKIKQVTDESFTTDVINSELPVLVDYGADWCGPCKMIAPVLGEIAENYASKLLVAKIDVDLNKEVAMKHSVRGIPTLMIFKNGEVIATKVGALSKSQLTAFLDEHI